MSRQNKVNPGMYTQRGRLTQDDAARELRKQSAIASPHTWQPVNTKTALRAAPADDDSAEPAPQMAEAKAVKGRSTATSASQARSDTAKTGTAKTDAAKAGTAKAGTAKAGAAKAGAAKTGAAKTSPAKTGTGKTGAAKTSAAKPGKALTAASKRTTTKPTRTAVLARNAGGPGAAPRAAAQRRTR